VQHCSDHFLAFVGAQFGYPLWRVLSVVAGDATVLRLTLFAKTRADTPSVRYVVDAVVLALYVPGIKMTLAAKLYSPDVGERKMLLTPRQTPPQRHSGTRPRTASISASFKPSADRAWPNKS